jgi:hypothetical protein
VGLLFTVEVSSSTTRTYEEIRTGVGDPGIGPPLSMRDTTSGSRTLKRNYQRALAVS